MSLRHQGVRSSDLAFAAALAALVGVVAVTLVYLLAEYPFGPFMLSVVAALVLAVVQGHRIAAWLAVAAINGGHFAGMALLDHDPGVAPWALVGS